MRGHCLLFSAERFISDRLKVTERAAGPGFKLGSNCAALVVSVWSRSAEMRQDWTRGCSNPPHSIQITLGSYHRVRNSGNKVQLWAGESRKVKGQTRY